MSNELGPVRLPNPVAEPPQQIGGVRIRSITRVFSSSPKHYEEILGAFAKKRAEAMKGNLIAIGARFIGDDGDTFKVDLIIPPELTAELSNNKWEPVKKEGRLLLVRPGSEDMILVEQKSSSPTSITGVVEEIFPKPQTSKINPPYNQEWQIIEGSLDTQPLTQPVEKPASHEVAPDNLRFIRPLTDTELEEAEAA